ncbi:MAG: TonB-dependent receptor plug domain-containing protein, partial [Desulfobacterales bacterium]|nr:TonB-dependent receptor plug domain-containing protein [Desulfobacterales bacterium]
MKRLTIKIALLMALATLAAAGLAFGESSEEQLEEVYLYDDVDHLVEAPTRNMTPVSKTAMNVSVFDADDLKNMNAHTLAEALNRIPGVYVSFSGADFGGASLLEIHAGEPRHTRVMIDGATINVLNGGSAETFGIPVGIISRVEVVKGVASAAWGSALGGLISIETKEWGNPGERGIVRVSYGSECLDYRAELSGNGVVDYYIYVGVQGSDGLRETRSFDATSFYAKFRHEFSSLTNIKLSIG